jgi:Ca-activated chloride channel family protein
MISFEITRFANPWMLLLLAVLLPMIALYVYRSLRGGPAISISTLSGFGRRRKTLRHYLRHAPFVLRCLAVAALVVALARPQNSEYGSSSTTEGIDIMLALDISGSMLARDFTPDRMSAAKEAAAKFIVDRRNDRIGLVVFAGESFTQSPLTTDKSALLNLLSRVRSGMIDDGTAIGNGLATAVNRLKDSPAKSKVVVLLTDGVNNAGQIAPLTAAEIARTYGIKVYTVGIGSMGMAPTPAIDMWGRMTFVNAKVEIDEKILTDIANSTGGQYFRATDNYSLGEIYDKINQLEKTKIETNDFTRYNELFPAFALIALVLLALEFIVRRFYLKTLP